MKTHAHGKFMRRVAAAYRAYKSTAKEQAEAAKAAHTAQAEPVIVKCDNEEDVTVRCLKREYCSGCGACMNLCPVHAITMEMDDEGFWAPVVDEAKCTHCGH